MAGGVGLTPMMSMVRTAAHRGDPRPYRLVVVASAPTDLLFREELADLRRYIDLEVTEVLAPADRGWSGPIGGINAGLMSWCSATVEQPGDLDYFICGPPAMVDRRRWTSSTTSASSPDRVHTEQFDFV